VQFDPAVAQVSRLPAKAKRLRRGKLPLSRPMCLLPQPLAIEVWSIVPDGPPVRFKWAGRTHRIGRSWGPERIETGWWRSRDVRRDYYRVETDDGRRFWLFRRVPEGDWFLHGSFE
jgi:protein ImuB